MSKQLVIEAEETQRVNVTQLLVEFSESRKFARMKAGSQKTYSHYLNKMIEALNKRKDPYMDLDMIAGVRSRSHIESLWKQTSQSEQFLMIAVLRAVLGWAIDKEIIPEIEVHWKPPRMEKSDVTPYIPEEIVKICSSTETENEMCYCVALRFMYWSHANLRQVIHLAQSDISEQHGVYMFGSDDRWHICSPEAASVLEEAKKLPITPVARHLVFRDAKGKALNAPMFYQIFETLCSRSSVEKRSTRAIKAPNVEEWKRK